VSLQWGELSAEAQTDWQRTTFQNCAFCVITSDINAHFLYSPSTLFYTQSSSANNAATTAARVAYQSLSAGSAEMLQSSSFQTKWLAKKGRNAHILMSPNNIWINSSMTLVPDRWTYQI